MVNELNLFRQKQDMNPILVLVAPLLFSCSPTRCWKPNAWQESPNPAVQNPILYLLLGWYFFPNDLNEIWQAASRGQPR